MRYRLAALATLAALWSGQAGAQELPYSVGVDRPFATAEARDALRAYLDHNGGQQGSAVEIPAHVWTALPNITQWGYSFEAQGNGALVRHRQHYDVSSVVSQINSRVAGLRDGGCSFLNVSGVDYSVGSQQISFSASLSGKRRTCADVPFVGRVVTDIADVSGSVRGRFGFTVTDTAETDKYRGTVVPNDIHADVDINTSIFGISSNSVVGDLLHQVVNIGSSPFAATSLGIQPVWSVMREIDRSLQVGGGSIVHASNYLMSGGGEVAEREYLQFLARIHNVTWSVQQYWQMDAQETVFSGSPSALELQIVFRASIAEADLVEVALADADAEVKLLRSFSEGTRIIVARRGDSWSRLARQNYGSEFYRHALRASQPVRGVGDRLRIGQEIQLPPLYRLSMINGGYVVRPGDTLIELCQRWEPQDTRACRRRIRELNPGLRPNWIPALSVLWIQPTTPIEPEQEDGARQ